MPDTPTLFHFDDGRESFEDLGKPNGMTRWREEDVRTALGYATPQSFEKALTRAKQTCLTLNAVLEDHFARQSDGTHLITRFGCFLIAMNGDPRKPEVAAAQAWFASIAETFQSHVAASDGIDRILIREDITDGQKSLHSTASRHGVENYAFFQNQGYIGMYNMGLQKLCEYKGIKKNEKLIDRMGKEEMAAHLFRITQTDAKIKNENIRGQAALENAARHVGQHVRKTMRDMSGSTPENLPISEHVNDVRKRLKGADKKMKALDGKKKKALPPPTKKNMPEEDE